MPHLGVGGVEHLEAPVQSVALDQVRGDPPSDRIGTLQQRYAEPGATQIDRSHQPGDPGTDDDDVHLS